MNCQIEGCAAKTRKDNAFCRLHSKCSYTDCDLVVYATGVCYNHYQKQYRGPTKKDSKLRCSADGCKRDPWRGRRKLEDGKEWEVRFVYDADKQYCSVHRPKGVMPTETFPKEWQE